MPWSAPMTESACFFFFNDTATTEIYTLSLHDALPILRIGDDLYDLDAYNRVFAVSIGKDRKSTRLNSSHHGISYAVFCLKTTRRTTRRQPGRLRRARCGGRRCARPCS